VLDEKVVITYDELMNNRVDELLKRQAEETALRIGMHTESYAENDAVSLVYKSWFNLMLAGLVGAFIAWACVEPRLGATELGTSEHTVASFLLFSLVGCFAGLLIGCLEGILSRNVKRALKGGLLGALIGFVGGILSTYVAGIVFFVIARMGIMILGEESFRDPAKHFSVVLFIMIARSLGWCIAGMTLGLGPGIALASKKLTLNGFIGGMLGGAFGGILFDPINYFVSGGTFESGAAISRAIGLVVIGAAAGLMIGLVELISMDAWLYMTEGPMRGKQFIIYKNPTFIGSSTSCGIYLFKDPYVNPWHAKVSIVRDGYLLEDNDSVSGTFVNGNRIKKHKLLPGDIIKIGESTLIYREKKKTKGGNKK